MTPRVLCDILLGIGIVGCAVAIIRLRFTVAALQRQISSQSPVEK